VVREIAATLPESGFQRSRIFIQKSSSKIANDPQMLSEDVGSCLRIWHVRFRGRLNDFQAFANRLEKQMEHLITVTTSTVCSMLIALAPMVMLLWSAMFLVSLLVLTSSV
jgi:hypothetical protein